LDCNECAKAAFASLENIIPGKNGTAMVESKCGANFAGT
jgi:hypothetical protein